MSQFKKTLAASLVSAFALFGATASQAATVTFDFDTAVSAPFLLTADSPGIVSGQCREGQCLGVNSQGAAVLSAGGMTFSVVSFWFKLIGNKTDLIVSTDHGSLRLEADGHDKHDKHSKRDKDDKHNKHDKDDNLIDLADHAMFQNITHLSFLTNKGNARIDDLKVAYADVAPVPLPASALLLLGGLGGLAALRRRKASV